MLFSAEKGVTNGGTIVHCTRRGKGQPKGKEGTIVHCEGEKERKAIDRRLTAEGKMGKGRRRLEGKQTETEKREKA
jgi:hypothetical protein